MKKPLGFATGSIWRWMKSANRNELLDYISPLDIQAVELTIGSEHELYALQISEKNISWLRGLNHVSIHAPDLHNSRENPNRLSRQLNAIENLVSLVKASSVVIHIEDLPPSEILDDLPLPVSIENTGPGNYTSPRDIAEVLDRHPDFSLCLDLAHAALTSERETGILVSLFRERISHIHLSGVCQNQDHQSLIGASDFFYSSILPALDLDVPFLIEEDISEVNPGYLKREVEAAGQLLSLG